MNLQNESIRLTKLIFPEIYAKSFPDRKDFDSFVIGLINKNKLHDVEYHYTSLYLHNRFNFHVYVTDNITFSITTFSFCMVWDDTRFNSDFNMDNIATYIGTPSYMFGRNESTDVRYEIHDEIKTFLVQRPERKNYWKKFKRWIYDICDVIGIAFGI